MRGLTVAMVCGTITVLAAIYAITAITEHRDSRAHMLANSTAQMTWCPATIRGRPLVSAVYRESDTTTGTLTCLYSKTGVGELSQPPQPKPSNSIKQM